MSSSPLPSYQDISSLRSLSEKKHMRIDTQIKSHLNPTRMSFDSGSLSPLPPPSVFQLHAIQTANHQQLNNSKATFNSSNESQSSNSHKNRETPKKNASSFVGKYEESLLMGRLSTPPSNKLIFSCEIGVLALCKTKTHLKCPPHIVAPFSAVFYDLNDKVGGNRDQLKIDSNTRKMSSILGSPFVGTVDLAQAHKIEKNTVHKSSTSSSADIKILTRPRSISDSRIEKRVHSQYKTDDSNIKSSSIPFHGIENGSTPSKQEFNTLAASNKSTSGKYDSNSRENQYSINSISLMIEKSGTVPNKSEHNSMEQVKSVHISEELFSEKFRNKPRIITEKSVIVKEVPKIQVNEITTPLSLKDSVNALNEPATPFDNPGAPFLLDQTLSSLSIVEPSTPFSDKDSTEYFSSQFSNRDVSFGSISTKLHELNIDDSSVASTPVISNFKQSFSQSILDSSPVVSVSNFEQECLTDSLMKNNTDIQKKERSLSTSTSTSERRRSASQNERFQPEGTYQLPLKGQLQLIIKNEHGTVVKIFLVPYDMREMPVGSRTFLRQKTYAVSKGEDCNEGLTIGTTSPSKQTSEGRSLRHAVHLQFVCLPGHSRSSVRRGSYNPSETSIERNQDDHSLVSLLGGTSRSLLRGSLTEESSTSNEDIINSGGSPSGSSNFVCTPKIDAYSNPKVSSPLSNFSTSPRNYSTISPINPPQVTTPSSISPSILEDFPSSPMNYSTISPLNPSPESTIPSSTIPVIQSTEQTKSSRVSSVSHRSSLSSTTHEKRLYLYKSIRVVFAHRAFDTNERVEIEQVTPGIRRSSISTKSDNESTSELFSENDCDVPNTDFIALEPALYAKLTKPTVNR